MIDIRHTPLHGRWQNMLNRCSNPKAVNYKHYGARGITVCDEWLDRDVFYRWAIKTGYSIELSIDRIDNDKGYYPDNCRWVDSIIQSRNTRVLRSSNTSGYRGVSKSGSKWKVQVNGIYIGIAHSKLSAARKYNKYVIDNNLGNTLNIIN